METNWISNFLDYLTFERRLSAHTVTAYRTDLEQFSAYLAGWCPGICPENAGSKELRAWVIYLVKLPLNAVSVNRKMATLRAFYQYLRKKRVISSDPSRLLVSLRKPEKIPEFVDEKSMGLLFEEVSFGDDFGGQRDRLVLELLYGTGIRLSELIGLKMNDLDLGRYTVKVMGKRARERIVPFPRGIAALLPHYLEARGSVGPNDRLLVTDAFRPMYPMFVQRLVKKYLTGITTSVSKGPHLLRHTYATHLLNRGADLNAIKELLGHSSLAATQIYTHNAIEELKKSFLQAHPKA